MPDYKASTISGTKWQRACRVVIENPSGGVPSALFVEEEAMTVDGRVVTRPVANLSCQMDPNSVLHQTIYNKLNELYVLLREERDSREA